jgi:hypothetical protein
MNMNLTKCLLGLASLVAVNGPALPASALTPGAASMMVLPAPCILQLAQIPTPLTGRLLHPPGRIEALIANQTMQHTGRSAAQRHQNL